MRSPRRVQPSNPERPSARCRMHELMNLRGLSLDSASERRKCSFFIVGCGRSGTTFLRLLLCRHSRIHIPPETWFILDLVRQLPRDRKLSDAEVEHAISIIVSSYRWPDFEIREEHLRAQLMHRRAPELADIIDLVYANLNWTGKPCLGDKTPPYIQIVPQLAQLYPTAKFIHLIRDGRDVAISFLDLNFYDEGSRFYDGTKFEWTAAVELADRYRTSPYAPRVLEVKYEDLVSDPAHTLAAICMFIGEKFENAMLDVRQESSASVPAREKIIHPKLADPISTNVLSAWRKKLSAFECFAMEACLGKQLGSRNYPLRFDPRRWSAVLTAFGAFLHLSGPVLARGLMYLRQRGLLRKKIYF